MLYPLPLKPGLFANGTRYQAKNRWYDASLIRQVDGTTRPIGGWVELRAEGLAAPGGTPEDSIMYDDFSSSGALAGRSTTFPVSGVVYDETAIVGATADVSAGALTYAGIPNNMGFRHSLLDFTAEPIEGMEFWFEITLPTASSAQRNIAYGYGFGGDGSSEYQFVVEFWYNFGDADGSWYVSIHDRNCSDFADTTNSWSGTGSKLNLTVPPGSYRIGFTLMEETMAGNIPLHMWRAPVGGGTRTDLTGTGTPDADPEFDADFLVGDQVALLAASVFNNGYSGYPNLYLPMLATGILSPDGIAGDPAVITLEGAPRAIVGWRGTDGNQVLAAGTNEKLYAHSVGRLYDITPEGFVPGTIDTTYNDAAEDPVGAYGDGDYGAGPYGAADPAQQSVIPAAVWHLDTFGQFLVGVCAPNDGTPYVWDKDPDSIAEPIENAPLLCRGIVVTPERFVVVLGPNGEARRVEWASQETLDEWTPAADNTAGGFDLEGVGNLVAGRRSKGETLLWTDDDLHAMRYIGGTLVYSFEKIGSKCGLIAPGAVALIDTKAVWMGNEQFHLYDGYVKNIPCEVRDRVFGSFNYDQRQKVTCLTIAKFGEIWWFYPSGLSSENDRYVVWNYRENTWYTGRLSRTCGVDAGALASPVMGNYTGKLYEHEKTFDRPVASGEAVADIPFIESGPVELAEGDDVMYVSQLLPDEKRLGQVQYYLYVAMYPDEDEVRYGPFSTAKLTDVRLSGRQVRVRVEEVVTEDWRHGVVRLDVTPAGRR